MTDAPVPATDSMRSTRSPINTCPGRLNFLVANLLLANIAPPPSNVMPKASDYSKTIEELINRAVQKLTVKLYTVDAFPSDELVKEWSQECWIVTCRAARKKFAPQEGNARIIIAISKRKSSIRSHLRDTVRDMIPSTYDLAPDAVRENVLVANMTKVTHLLSGTPKRFGYKDFDAAEPEIYAELPMLMHALQKQLFINARDTGPEFHTAFDPMPIPTLAFLLTCAEYGLDSWSAGKLDQAHQFRTSEYRAKYRSHLSWLIEDWEALDAEAVRHVRHEMYQQVLRYGNITIQSTTQKTEKASDETRERMRRALATRTFGTRHDDDF
ncbi:uncharacterized protein PHACADRAFT_203402 [Phanerochaete carnosa HHB-10118-sp]|uniref:DUF6532 domain-containing protein n=1 Tax=Phanerochaete carnosa (strain HHB-10118-sp) TaxID=650164 RepID=K5WCT6_PHACS|nr:uncharacterized protein PHACADRAFT_203402 [Phanerochaete carnosa HHB-10118-sp]EKM47992.1 hypothetical protein PHACADRAFT_203402 [Phanerochaete carnosa HHB-10118-sp]